MLSSQQLYLVNHFALVARRHGLHLPDLKELLRDEALLRQHVEAGLLPTAQPAVADAAAKVATALSWRAPAGTTAAPAAAAPAQAPRGQPAPPPGGTTPPGLSPQERERALAALQEAAGPIAGFIAEQVDALGPMGLSRYLDQAADLAQLSAARRRALRAACGLAPD